MTTPVSSELAKLLKEKGIEIKSPKGYYNHGGRQLLLWVEGEEHNNQKDFISYAPTISEVVMWLYEKYWVWIWVSMEIAHVTTFCWHLTGHRVSSNYRAYLGSPTEAYEDAIEYAIEHTLKQKLDKQ